MSGLKFMGKDPAGNAKAISVNDDGVLLVELLGSLLVGEVVENPTANTILGRMKSLESKIDTLDVAINSILAKIIASPATEAKQTALEALVGTLTDTAVNDPTASGTIIALLKGLITQMQGDGASGKSMPVQLSGSNVADGSTVTGVSFELDDDGNPVLRVVDAAPFAYDAEEDIIKTSDINQPKDSDGIYEYPIKDNYGYFDRLSRALELSLNYRAEYYYDAIEYISWVAGYSKGTPILTKETDHFRLIAESEEGDGTEEGAYVTDVAVDLTNINWLYIDWENIGTSHSQVMSYLEASTNKTAASGTYDAILYITRAFTRRISRLNVAALTGSYYIRVHSRDNSSLAQPGRKSDLKVYGVWGMK